MKTMNELNKIAHELRDVRAMIKELEAEEEMLRDQLKAAMVEQEKEVIEGDTWKASWVNVNNNRFDTKSFKAEHEDMYNQYLKSTTGTRFVFTA